MSMRDSPQGHLLLPWAVQEREDPVLEFDHAEGMYFFDRQGRRYLDFVAQVFHCTLGHGNRRIIETNARQAEQACCVSPQMVTADRAALAAELARRTPAASSIACCWSVCCLVITSACKILTYSCWQHTGPMDVGNNS